MTDIVDIGTSRRDAATNTILVQAKSAPVGENADAAPGFDDSPIFGTLGVAAIPWPPDARGGAQGLVDESVPGYSGVITNIRDLRAAGVVEELGPGETAIHATGPGFDSRIFLKKQSLSMMVGNDCAIVLDREEKKFAISCFGLHFEMSAENGITMTSGGATSQLKDAMNIQTGTVILGGRTPVFPVAQMMTPVLIGVAPLSPIAGIAPGAGVFIGV